MSKIELTPDRLLLLKQYRMKHLEYVTGFSRIAIHNWIKQGIFPEGTSINGRVKVWQKEEVEAFMRGQWYRDKAAA